MSLTQDICLITTTTTTIIIIVIIVGGRSETQPHNCACVSPGAGIVPQTLQAALSAAAALPGVL